MQVGITERNFEIVKATFGENHFFGMKVFMTAYLTSIMKGSGEATAEIFKSMLELKYRDQVIK